MINWQEQVKALWRHFGFYLSRAISHPLVNPDMLQLCFLFRCNLSCRMCNMREREKIVKSLGLNYELSFKTIIDLIDQATNLGIKQLFLLGGEPFLRDDLFDIIKYAHSRNIRTLVSTNGTLLGNPGIIEKILESGLDDLIVSIDGANENTFKKIRGEGFFEKILTNIRLLNSMKREINCFVPKIIILCTIMDQNIEELLDIVHLARRLDAACVGFQPVVKDNTDARLRDNADPNWVPESRYDTLDRSLDALIKHKLLCKENFEFIFTSVKQLEMAKKYFRGVLPRQNCYTGFNRMIISQDGKIYFCAQEPQKGEISFGDIHRESLKDLWYSRQATIFRKSIKKCNHPCLLGCSLRDEFERVKDNFYWNFRFRSGIKNKVISN